MSWSGCGPAIRCRRAGSTTWCGPTWPRPSSTRSSPPRRRCRREREAVWHRRPSLRRRRRVPRVAVLAGVVSVSVAVAAYALVTRPSSKPQNVACFAAADLTAKTAVVGVDARGPVAACAGLWARGFLGATPPPSLQACLLESGVVGVFPEAAGRDVCVDLGLAAASSPAPPSDRHPPGVAAGPVRTIRIVDHTRFFAFRDAVLSRFVGQGCIGRGGGGGDRPGGARPGRARRLDGHHGGRRRRGRVLRRAAVRQPQLPPRDLDRRPRPPSPCRPRGNRRPGDYRVWGSRSQ